MGLSRLADRAEGSESHRRESKSLSRDLKLKGQKSHTTMSAAAVRETARSTAAEAIDMQKEEFRSLAVMADWDNTDGVYITMSE
jgi:isoleucyl-tRNA synthetase